jgi:hypothetical protein
MKENNLLRLGFQPRPGPAQIFSAAGVRFMETGSLRLRPALAPAGKPVLPSPLLIFI